MMTDHDRRSHQRTHHTRRLGAAPAAETDRQPPAAPIRGRRARDIPLALVLASMILAAACLLPGSGITAPALGPAPSPTAAATPIVTQAPEEAWRAYLAEPPQPLIHMTWEYRPTSLDAVPPGVNVLVPTWFYVEEDEEGLAVVRSLDEMGYSSWDPAGYVQTAHAGGAQVWGCIVSFTPDLSEQLVTDPERADAFIARCNQWIEAYGLDGISFDFEKMDPQNKQLFNEFVDRCKKQFPAGTVVSAAVTVPLPGDTSSNWWQCYDRGGLSEVCDYLAVMTYDSYQKGRMDPVADIRWVAGKIEDMMEEGVPSNKILLGVPFYGADYRGQLLDGDVYTVDPLWAESSKNRVTITAGTIQRALSEGRYSAGGTEIVVDYWVEKGTWDNVRGISTWSFVDSEGVLHTLWSEDERSLYQKGLLCRQYQLAGAAVWQKGLGQDALWRALSRGLGLPVE